MKGSQGVITVVGVKWTPHDIAEETVNLAIAHLPAPSIRFSRRRCSKLHRCGCGDFERFVADAKFSRPASFSDASL
jgi:glycerol-3-phosphate dehydrogenase